MNANADTLSVRRIRGRQLRVSIEGDGPPGRAPLLLISGIGAPLELFEPLRQALTDRTTITFDDYTDSELREIFTQMAAKSDYDVGEGVLDAFTSQLAEQSRDSTFGNGRFARNLLEAAIGRHAWRLREVTEPSLEQLRTILADDLVEPAAEPAAVVAAGQLQPPESAAPIAPVEFPATPGGPA